MEVRFWGVRGSIAKAGPTTVRYGGNTSCVEVRSAAGTLVTLDCGTGALGLGHELIANGAGPLRGHLLISHTHWDHIQGLPFFAPLFDENSEWDIYAPSGVGQSLRETLAGQMQYQYFPITIDRMGATIRYHELGEGSFSAGDIHVRTRYLNHPALTLGYRLEADGVVVVYACDHEPHSRALASGTGEIVGQDSQHVEFLQGADLVIHDAQYMADEYPGKVGWGHSTAQYAVAMCKAAGARRLALTHHDPLRDDDALDRVVATAKRHAGESLEVFAAAEGPILRISAAEERASIEAAGESATPATASIEPSALAGATETGELSVVAGIADDRTAELVTHAASDEAFRLTRCRSREAVEDTLGRTLPSLVLLEDHADIDALILAREIRSADDDSAREVPIVAISDACETTAAAENGITDWLTRPVSSAYVRSRVRAWLMRATPRWNRAPLPVNEETRIDALHSLNVLDTPQEERFDRITRLVSIALEMPIVVISLVDRERQWFKSCVGLDASETPREEAFCAHAILKPNVMVVRDTLLDDRFAENPLVIDGPRIRFYAGCPLTLDNGATVGTLCCIDTRPRDFDETMTSTLADFAELVKRELVVGASPPGSAEPPAPAGEPTEPA